MNTLKRKTAEEIEREIGDRVSTINRVRKALGPHNNNARDVGELVGELVGKYWELAGLLERANIRANSNERDAIRFRHVVRTPKLQGSRGGYSSFVKAVDADRGAL